MCYVATIVSLDTRYKTVRSGPASAVWRGNGKWSTWIRCRKRRHCGSWYQWRGRCKHGSMRRIPWGLRASCTYCRGCGVWLWKIVYMDSGADHEGKAAGGVSGGSAARGVCAVLSEVWGCHAPVSRRGFSPEVLKGKRTWASGACKRYNCNHGRYAK